MNHYRISFILLSLFLYVTTANAVAEELAVPVSQKETQHPTPSLLTQFKVPMPDGTQATAFILRTDANQVMLCLATSNGQVGLWTMTPGNSPPSPTPTPDPPPLPQKLHIAIVVDPATLTLEQRNVLANRTWRQAAASDHWFHGIVPVDAQEGDTGRPPADLLPFLDRAREHNLPWVIMCDTAGKIVLECPLPKTAEEMRRLIPKPSTTK
jgi:hypothetical protein